MDEPSLKSVAFKLTWFWCNICYLIYETSVMFIITWVFHFYFRAMYYYLLKSIEIKGSTVMKWANKLIELTLHAFLLFFHCRIKMIKRVSHIFKLLAAWKDWKHSISKKAFLCLQTKYCSKLAEKMSNVWNLFNVNNRVTRM